MSKSRLKLKLRGSYSIQVYFVFKPGSGGTQTSKTRDSASRLGLGKDLLSNINTDDRLN